MRHTRTLVLTLAVLASQHAAAAQYWLADVDPVNQRAKHRDGPADYMQLFSPQSPWQQSAARLSVFKISAQLVLAGDPDMLRTIFTDLRRRHVAIAVESAALIRSPECGFGEGMARPDLLDRVGGRLRSLGLTIDDMAMDEPIWFGHEKTWGHNDCAYPVPEAARRVAQGVAQIRRYFPNLRVGDIEVVSDRIAPRQLASDYAEFARDFAQDTGTPLAFMHADVAWRGDWQPALTMVGREMHKAGIRFGVIVGGGRDATTDAEFGAVAEQHLRLAAANPASRPDDVVVQSWQPLPNHMLPETQPGSATNILLQAEDTLQ